MKSLWQNGTRDGVLARIGHVHESARPLWGKMTVDRMLSHLTESMKMASGDLPVAPMKLPLRFFPIKQLGIYVIPIAKGLPTAPELLAGAQQPLDTLKVDLARAIARFAERSDAASYPDHPAFGRMSRLDWGVLTYRHLDHHLRQFEV